MAFDFDRAAVIVAALSSKPVNPMSLNPYRKKFVRSLSVNEFKRYATSQFRALKKAGKVETQTISASRVKEFD